MKKRFWPMILIAVWLSSLHGIAAQTTDSSELDRIKNTADEERKDQEVDAVLVEEEKGGATNSKGAWFSLFKKDRENPETKVEDDGKAEDEETRSRRKRLREIEEELKKNEEDSNRTQAKMHEIRVRLLKEDKELGELHQKIMALHRELAIKIDRTQSMRPLIGDLLGIDTKRKELELERIRIQKEIERKKTE
jgi:hypothetical protein